MRRIIPILFLVFCFAQSRAQGDLKIADRHNVWDTIAQAWQGNDSALYFYDGQHRLSSEIHLRYNTTTSSWDSATNIIYTYHPVYGLLAIKDYQVYSGGTWTNNYRESFTYDIDTLLQYHTWYAYSSGYVPTYREEYYYDSLNSVKLYYSKDWNSGTNSYVNHLGTVYHFNSLHQNDTIRNVTWSGSAWQNSTLQTYTYNSQSQETGESHYSWQAGAWLPIVHYDVSHNAQNKVTEQIAYLFQFGSFALYSKKEYTYQNDLYLTKREEYNWDNVNGQWNLYGYTDYVLNSAFSTLHATEFQLHGSGPLMDTLSQFVWEYDGHNNPIHQVNAYRVNYLSLLRQSDEYFYWYQQFNSVPEIGSDVHLRVFPNPAINDLNLEFVLKDDAFVRAVLIDNSGALVKTIASRQEGPGLTRYQIDLHGLAAGAYYLKLNVGDHSTGQKVIVK